MFWNISVLSTNCCLVTTNRSSWVWNTCCYRHWLLDFLLSVFCSSNPIYLLHSLSCTQSFPAVYSRVPSQNGVSQAWYIVEIHHSGRKPSPLCCPTTISTAFLMETSCKMSKQTKKPSCPKWYSCSPLSAWLFQKDLDISICFEDLDINLSLSLWLFFKDLDMAYSFA